MKRKILKQEVQTQHTNHNKQQYTNNKTREITQQRRHMLNTRNKHNKHKRNTQTTTPDKKSTTKQYTLNDKANTY